MKLVEKINIVVFEFLIIWTVILLMFLGNSISELSEILNVKGLWYPCLSILLVVVFGVVDLWKGEDIEKVLSKRSSLYLCISLFCVTIIKLYISYGAFFHSGWDVRTIRWTVEYLLYGDGPVEYLNSYYSYNSNNLLIIWVYKMIALLCNKFGYISWEYGVVILNNLLSILALYLVYKITYILTGKIRLSWYTYLYALIFVGFSPWFIITYSDSLCFAFPIIAIRLFVLYKQHQKTKGLVLLYALLLGGISCLGLYMKPQVFIVYISIAFFEAIGSLHKKNFNGLFFLSTSFASFLLFYVLVMNICIPSLDLELDKEKSMGWQHYFMQGLNEETVGAYSETDIAYSRSFDTRKERNQFNLIEARKRITNMGLFGLIDHINRKEMLNYGYGTFSWGWEGAFWEEIPDWAYNRSSAFARNFIMPEGKYYIPFQKGMNFLWISALILCSFAGLRSKSIADENSLMTHVIILSIIGLTLFELIFESRSRYLFTYSPLFIVLAGIGFSNISDMAKPLYINCVNTLKNKRASFLNGKFFK